MRPASRRAEQTRPLADALGPILAPIVRSREDPLQRVRLAWSEICGSVLSQHAAPLAIEDGLLVVGAHGDQWREAMFQQRLTLQARIRRCAPEVRGVRLRTLPVRAPTVAAAPEPAPPSDPRTQEIAHGGLRSALDGLLAAQRRRTPETR